MNFRGQTEEFFAQFPKLWDITTPSSKIDKNNDDYGGGSGLFLKKKLKSRCYGSFILKSVGNF